MLRTLVKDSAVYAVGTIASRLVGFIMIPVYTRVLTPADYGIIETIVRLVDIIGLLLSLGLAEALLRHYYLAKTDEERNRLIGTVFNLNLLVVLAGALIFWPLAPWVARLTFGHDRYAHYVAVSLIGMMIGSLIELPLTLWRAEGKPWRFTIISLLKLFTQLSTNIVLVVWFRWGVWGVVVSSLLNAVIWSAVLGVLVRVRYGSYFDKRWLVPVLRYGLPLVPASLSQFVLHYSDRFFLVRYVSESELGLYSLAYRFGMLVSVFFGVLSRAWWPWVFDVATTTRSEYHLRRGSALLLVTATIFCSGVILLADPTIRLLSAPSFHPASLFVAPIAFGYWFFVSSSVFRIGALVSDRTSVFAVANVASAALCLGLNAALIPLFHVWGAAYATLGAFVAFALFVAVGSHRVHPIRYDGRIVVLSIVLLVFVSACSHLLRASLWVEVGGRATLWLMVVGISLVAMVKTQGVRLPWVLLRRS
jgi:O-antigen/teichoic acid export membrane protein